MNNSIVHYSIDAGVNRSGSWNPEQIALIKSQIAVNCTDDELALFLQVCKLKNLDPFSKEIYAIKRDVWNSATRTKESKMTIQVSIDGFGVIAARSGNYAGLLTEWCGDDGIWKDVWLAKTLPAAAKTTVYTKQSHHKFTGVALFSDYAQTDKDGNLVAMWKKMPAHMIGKCSRSLALRTAFPAELSGLYTTEEFPPPEQPEIEHLPTLNPLPPTDRTNRLRELKIGVVDKIKALEWSEKEQYQWASKLHGKPSSEWSLQEWSMADVDLQDRIDKQAEADISPIDLADTIEYAGIQ